jgi:hypothetical protein
MSICVTYFYLNSCSCSVLCHYQIFLELSSDIVNSDFRAWFWFSWVENCFHFGVQFRDICFNNWTISEIRIRDWNLHWFCAKFESNSHRNCSSSMLQNKTKQQQFAVPDLSSTNNNKWQSRMMEIVGIIDSHIECVSSVVDLIVVMDLASIHANNSRRQACFWSCHWEFLRKHFQNKLHVMTVLL